MRFYIFLAILAFVVRKSWSVSTNCQATGGDDDGNGLAVTCNTDSDKPVPFPNLVKAINGLTIYNVNTSGDVNADAANVDSLSYIGNSAEIPDNAFSAFKNLRELIIDFSQSAQAYEGGLTVPPPINLKPNAFKGLEGKLVRLEMIGTNLANAGGLPAAVKSLTSLESLKLEDCYMKGQLKGSDLQGMKNLKHLEITTSPDLAIGDDVFANNANLERVLLTYVQMKSIPKSVGSLKSLKEFKVEATDISGVPTVFQGSGSTLRELSLTNSQISTIDAGAFKGLSALTTLILSYNKISSLPRGLFDDLVSLESLHLDGNALTTSGVQNSFTNLRKLKSLSLGANKLDSITPGTLAGLENSVTSLYFSENQIKTIKGTSKLTQSPQFDLAANGIESVTKDTFEDGSSFSELNLGTNPIAKIQPGAFAGITVGSAFSVEDTSLTEFDLATLTGLKGVQNLTITFNGLLRAIKVSSDSAVPSTLKNIIIDSNDRLVLTDEGKLGSYLQKSGARLILLNRVYCHCRIGWLRERKANVLLSIPNDFGDPEPATCCNNENTVEEFLSDAIFKQQCAGDKDKSLVVNDDDKC